MRHIAGFSFENARRHIFLHCYNEEANHDKVYHIVVEAADSKFKVSAMWGRRSSSLRLAEKTKWVSEYTANTVVSKLISDKTREGYIIQEDESFSKYELPPELVDAIENDNDSPIWSARQYAENPVRATKVNPEFDIKGYAVVLLPEGKRILTLIEGKRQLFFDQNGSEIKVADELVSAVIDLDGHAVIDGLWDGERYLVYDLASEAEYRERVQSLATFIDGTVDESIVQLSDVYLTAAESEKAVLDARELGAKTIIGFKLSSTERPGQNDTSRVVLTLRPRVCLCVKSKAGQKYELGVDDGLGVFAVCHLEIDEPLEIGDKILVEYSTWSGYGSELANPSYIKKLENSSDFSIDQLLAV